MRLLNGMEIRVFEFDFYLCHIYNYFDIKYDVFLCISKVVFGL